MMTFSFAKAVLYVMIKLSLAIKCDIKDIKQYVQQWSGFYCFISSLLGEKGTSNHRGRESVS